MFVINIPMNSTFKLVVRKAHVSPQFFITFSCQISRHWSPVSILSLQTIRHYCVPVFYGMKFCWICKWLILSRHKQFSFQEEGKTVSCHKIILKVDGIEFPWSSTVKYLGVVLDQKVIFKDHISHVINKVNVTLKILYPLINRRPNLSIENKILILKLIFHAILFYAAPFWYDAAECQLKRS